MTEREKMTAGLPYLCTDPELTAQRQHAKRLAAQLNNADPADTAGREALLRELLGSAGASPTIEPRFQCDYGFNIHVGDRFYMNFDCVILDVRPVRFGDDCLVGPQAGFYTATHPLDHEQRAAGFESAEPIIIGNRCWIGGRAVVLPGVTLGDNVVVAAGAVVTQSFPANVLVGGVPARVIRQL